MERHSVPSINRIKGYLVAHFRCKICHCNVVGRRQELSAVSKLKNSPQILDFPLTLDTIVTLLCYQIIHRHLEIPVTTFPDSCFDHCLVEHAFIVLYCSRNQHLILLFALPSSCEFPLHMTVQPRAINLIQQGYIVSFRGFGCAYCTLLFYFGFKRTTDIEKVCDNEAGVSVELRLETPAYEQLCTA